LNKAFYQLASYNTGGLIPVMLKENIQPDIQYIINPGKAALSNAFVGISRLKLELSK